MGTSSSSGGPKQATPLLPPWALGNGGNDDPYAPPTNEPSAPPGDSPPANPPAPDDPPSPDDLLAPISPGPVPLTGSWRGPKSTMGRIAPGRSTIQRAGRSYVRNLGGARQASTSARAGKQAMVNLGGFLSGVSDRGLEPTLREYGLTDCIGQPAQVVFARIADRIAPTGSTIDEVHAREAILRALETIWERCEMEGRDVATLENLTPVDLREAILRGISAYIYNRWLYETGYAIQTKEVSVEAVAAVEGDAKDFVLSAVLHDFDQIDVIATNFGSPECSRRMNKIFESAYAFIERQS